MFSGSCLALRSSRWGRPGPVVQSIVSLTSSLVVKMLTLLVSTISNTQLFLLKKCECELAFAHIFSAKILACMPY